MTDSSIRTQETLADAIGKARHSLQALHDPTCASVTVHGRCPSTECETISIVEVHADTHDYTCDGCGQAFAA
jgi:hypothetical protein